MVGYSIEPKIIVNNNPLNFLEAKKNMETQNLINPNSQLVKKRKNIEDSSRSHV